MAKGSLNLQDLFLNQLRKEKVNVTIFLLSGFQLKGVIKGFDNFTLIVETDNNKQQLIYKHAISFNHALKANKLYGSGTE